LIALWSLLALEAAGGLVLFCTRLIAGTAPGETLHVLGGALLCACYAAYQWRHWHRVAPVRARLDYALGLIAATSMAACLLTGVVLAVPWWQARVAQPALGAVRYPTALSALHNIASVAVLTFVGAHLGAVLMRDRRRDD
jgi:hypothetical protein